MTQATPPAQYRLLSVEEAQERILEGLEPLGAVELPLAEALGRVLAQDIIAARDVPPWANSAMDGYALRASDLASTSLELPVSLVVQGTGAAGEPAQALLPGHTIRIMTGAPLPPGADTVVRFEDVYCVGDRVIFGKPERLGRNVRQAGEDLQSGSLVLKRGCILRPQELGLIAATGIDTVLVGQQPRVAVMATGNEVVEPGQELQPGQIYNTNAVTNLAQVARSGGIGINLGVVRDEPEAITRAIRRGLRQGVQLFVTSGGVSAGDYDLIKHMMLSQGELDFWWINIKPGRPLAFGTLAGAPIVALPGNPVAAFISFELFVRPAIIRLQGGVERERPVIRARLAEAIKRKDGRRHYLRARLHNGPDGLSATLTGDQGSGIMSSLTAADALVVIPESAQELAAGTEVEVLLI
ncbi:MAG: molybdopterin molybdotransferase MoeA [Chloroflexi bacterium]|nr:molybdopterin molybdotransferase MoeA [Chloroflexota bacterium]